MGASESTRLSCRAFEPASHLRSADETGLLEHRPAVAEYEEVRYARDAVTRRKRRLALGIYFEHERLTGHLARQSFDFRRGHAAGTAPGCPEIDQHRNTRLAHDLFKRARVYFNRLADRVEGGLAGAAFSAIRQMFRRNAILRAALWTRGDYGVMQPQLLLYSYHAR